MANAIPAAKQVLYLAFHNSKFQGLRAYAYQCHVLQNHALRQIHDFQLLAELLQKYPKADFLLELAQYLYQGALSHFN